MVITYLGIFYKPPVPSQPPLPTPPRPHPRPPRPIPPKPQPVPPKPTPRPPRPIPAKPVPTSPGCFVTDAGSSSVEGFYLKIKGGSPRQFRDWARKCVDNVEYRKNNKSFYTFHDTKKPWYKNDNVCFICCHLGNWIIVDPSIWGGPAYERYSSIFASKNYVPGLRWKVSAHCRGRSPVPTIRRQPTNCKY